MVNALELLSLAMGSGVFAGVAIRHLSYKIPLAMEAGYRAELIDLLGEEQASAIPTPFPPLDRGMIPRWVLPVAAAASTVFATQVVPAGLQLWLAVLLIWTLLLLAAVDINVRLLPDSITLPLLWSGMLANLIGGFTSLNNSVLGAAVGYLLFWSISTGYRRLTGKDGLGEGDAKLLAALGAWFGVMALPQIVMVAAVAAALAGMLLIAMRGRASASLLPLGPFLALSGLFAFIPVMHWPF